jgi:exopolysaccharide production protein ExoQ
MLESQTIGERGEADLAGTAPERRSKWFLAEQVFAIAGILILSQALINFIFLGPRNRLPAGNDGSLGIRLIYLSLYAVTALLLLPHWRTAVKMIFRERFLLLFLLLALASSWWSVAPVETFRKCIGLGGAALFGLYLAVRFTVKQQLYMVALALAIAVVGSVVCAMGFPAYGTMRGFHRGAWRGLYIHKNIFGQYLLLALIVFLLLCGNVRRHWQCVPAVLAALAVIALCLSAAKVALAAAVLVAATAVGYWGYRRQWPNALIAVILGVVLMTGLFSTLQNFQQRTRRTEINSLILNERMQPNPLQQRVIRERQPALSGQVTSLTGRVPLWRESIDYIASRPFHGYGYHAFWTVHGATIAQAWGSDWQVPNAHNAVIEITLALGLPGLLVLTLSFGTAATRGIRNALGTRQGTAWWPVLYLAYLIPISATDSVIARPNSMAWVLFTALALSMTRVGDRQVRANGDSAELAA